MGKKNVSEWPFISRETLNDNPPSFNLIQYKQIRHF